MKKFRAMTAKAAPCSPRKTDVSEPYPSPKAVMAPPGWRRSSAWRAAESPAPTATTTSTATRDSTSMAP